MLPATPLCSAPPRRSELLREESPRRIASARACRIIERLPTFVSLVGVFVDHLDPQGLGAPALSIGIHAVQLHGNESPDPCSMIRKVKVIKAYRVKPNFKVDVSSSVPE